jgi:hypothetical protein
MISVLLQVDNPAPNPLPAAIALTCRTDCLSVGRALISTLATETKVVNGFGRRFRSNFICVQDSVFGAIVQLQLYEIVAAEKERRKESTTGRGRIGSDA